MSIEDFSTIDRRSLMRRAMMLVGASAAASGCDMLPGLGNDRNFSLDAQQMALLNAVAGTIMPKTETAGAIEAGVPAKFEDMLREWASFETRSNLVGALQRIDNAAIDEGADGFAAMATNAQLSLLSAHDRAALTEDPDGKAIVTTLPFAGSGPPLHDADYGLAKELILTLYYCSEPALTEELSYEHNPGAWEPSIPVTEATRPKGGLGLL